MNQVSEKRKKKNSINPKIVTLCVAIAAVVIIAAAVFIISAVSNKKNDEPSSAIPESSAESNIPETEKKKTETTTKTETSAPTTSVPTTSVPTTSVPETAAETTLNVTEKQAETTKNPSSSGIRLLTEPQMISLPSNDSEWKLVLLNTFYRVSENVDDEINFVPAIEGSGELLDYRAAEAYQKMYDAGKADGVTLTPISGYRSYSKQKYLYNNLVEEYLADGYSQAESEALASTRRMPPGSSEHNIGIAMDIGWVDSRFADSAEYEWLCNNADDYGFILRYTEENKKYTGVKAEPWHWRYVGVENASKIKESGLSLEEYLGKVN